ncbi:coiled-coil domain-containing protein [Nonomuraea sp. NPDC049309]|uniref:coiled-coil domain-containing protein n=1 Tax=Nonomuraea sp. NPDC049309 TaxID=3364350 RepID=UPI003719F621
MKVRAAMVSAALCAGALASPAPAMADPSPAQARARLVKLNEKADQLVERYNRATEAYRKARERYRALDAEAARDGARAEELRAQLAELAARDYRLGSPLGWQRFMGKGDPESVLGGMAALEALARDRAARLRAFEAATARLREKRDRARDVLAEAEKARDAVRREQAEVDKLVDQQTALLGGSARTRRGIRRAPAARTPVRRRAARGGRWSSRSRRSASPTGTAAPGRARGTARAWCRRPGGRPG